MLIQGAEYEPAHKLCAEAPLIAQHWLAAVAHIGHKAAPVEALGEEGGVFL